MITKAVKMISVIVSRIEAGKLESSRGWKLVNFIAKRYNVQAYVNDIVNGYLRIV